MQTLTAFISQLLLFLENERVASRCPCVSAIVTRDLVHDTLPKGKRREAVVKGSISFLQSGKPKVNLHTEGHREGLTLRLSWRGAESLTA